MPGFPRGADRRGSYQILYSSSCDPRTDPEVCLLTSDVARLDPFYDAVGVLGELTYSNAADVPSLDAYSAVILDFCEFPSPSQADLDAIMAFLRAGGRVMVAAQDFCPASIGRATQFLAPFDVEYTNIDPAVDDYIIIPIEEQVGFLEGVAEFYPWRWTPQILGIGSDFFPNRRIERWRPLCVWRARPEQHSVAVVRFRQSPDRNAIQLTVSAAAFSAACLETGSVTETPIDTATV